MNNFTVYMHVVPNGKRYIGITSRDPVKRWNRGSGYNSNREFYNDIQQFGWNMIEHVIVDSGLKKEEAEELEVKLIAEYQTTNPNYGYNYTRGGNYSYSDSAKEKLRRSANPVNCVPCMCLETKKTYKSISNAAQCIGVKRSSIDMSCMTDGRRSARGLHFVYLDQDKREQAVRRNALKDARNWDFDW